MKKSGILNAQLIRCIAELGHKDLFMIGDAAVSYTHLLIERDCRNDTSDTFFIHNS